MLRPLAIALSVLAVATPMAGAETFPNEARVTGPELTAGLDAGLGYWANCAGKGVGQVAGAVREAA
jgi:hypothetical protein